MKCWHQMFACESHAVVNRLYLTVSTFIIKLLVVGDYHRGRKLWLFSFFYYPIIIIIVREWLLWHCCWWVGNIITISENPNQKTTLKINFSKIKKVMTTFSIPKKMFQKIKGLICVIRTHINRTFFFFFWRQSEKQLNYA